MTTVTIKAINMDAPEFEEIIDTIDAKDKEHGVELAVQYIKETYQEEETEISGGEITYFKNTLRKRSFLLVSDFDLEITIEE